MKCAIKFSWSFKLNAYRATMNLSNSEQDNANLILRFDTGAGSTILSLLDVNILFNELKYTKEQLQSLFNLYKVPYKQFKTPTEEILVGYPCKLNNVIINDCLISDFYFFLCLDDLNEVSLLGADFIRSCSLTKNIEGAINVTEIDLDRYYNNFKVAAKSSSIISLNRL